jgi:uncharacterized protein (TIGR02597 family)
LQSNTHYVLIRSGPQEGDAFTITGNGPDTLTLDLEGETLAALDAGDSVAIIPYWTLGTLFRAGQGINASPTPGNRRTEILVPDIGGTGVNLGTARTHYFWNGAWRQVGQGTAVRNDDVIPTDSYLWVRQNLATATELVVAGGVLPTRWRLFIQRNGAGKQDNLVALPRAFTMSLDGSGLFESGAFGTSPTPGNRLDELLVFDNAAIAKNKSAVALYYYWSGAWRKVGGGAVNVGGDGAFAPGTGAILRAGSASGPVIWVNQRGY